MKLLNYLEYDKLYENEISDKLTSSLVSIMLNDTFKDLDVEKVIVNSAQIISIIVSFFDKFGIRISLTIETLLMVYWIWKYKESTDAEVKHDAMIQIIFASFGFAAFGAGPVFKSITSLFSKGYREYRVTGNVSKLAKSEIILKNENTLKNAAKNLEKTVEENVNKIPKQIITKETRAEIKTASSDVKKYIDDVFEKEAKNIKKIKGSKVKTASKLIKLGKRIFPLASYLLSRYLNKKKKPAHVEEVENDFAILQYSIDNKKIIGADLPNDMTLNDEKRLAKNGKVIPTIIGLKILLEDIDNKKIIGGYNILTDSNIDYQYYLMCATNGVPIFNNFKIFAITSENRILISDLIDDNIQFVKPTQVIKKIKNVSLISNESADEITKKNFKKVLDAYQANLNVTSSLTMWSKIIEKTFTRKWWDKNFKLKSKKEFFKTLTIISRNGY